MADGVPRQDTPPKQGALEGHRRTWPPERTRPAGGTWTLEQPKLSERQVPVGTGALLLTVSAATVSGCYAPLYCSRREDSNLVPPVNIL